MNNQRFSDEVRAELKELSLRISHLTAKVGLLELEKKNNRAVNQSLLSSSMANSMFVKKTDTNCIYNPMIVDDAVSMKKLSPEVRDVIMKLLTNSQSNNYMNTRGV